MSVDDQTPVAIIGQPATTAVDLLRGAGFPVETGYVGYDVRSTQVLAKVDLQLGGGQSLGVRFNAARSLDENIEPWGGLTARSGGAAISVEASSADFQTAPSGGGDCDPAIPRTPAAGDVTCAGYWLLRGGSSLVFDL